MKEILQLFRRDAEHAPPKSGTEKYDLGTKPRILMEGTSVSSGGSGQSSREASVFMTGERQLIPKVEAEPKSVVPKEDKLYGRRW